MNNYFSSLFFIRASKLKKNGEAPLFLRVTIGGTRAEVRLKRSIPVNKWNSKKERSTGKDKVSLQINQYLDVVQASILSIYTELKQKNYPITPEILIRKFEGQGTDFKSVLKELNSENQKCRALIGKEYVEKTVQRHDRLERYLGEFLQIQYQVKDISFNELNHEFITGFEHYLKTVKKCEQNTAVKYLQSFKKITILALKNKWIADDPFDGFKFKRKKTNREFLLEDELSLLKEKEFKIPRLDVVRDIFLFCCFTGLAFTDIKDLTREHIVTDSNGNNWIRKARTKTDIMSSIPLLDIPKQLIEKYKDHPKCKESGSLLPVPSNQRMNSYLKDIATSCGWTKNLTTHCARHTFATIALANQVSLSSVAKMLGHTNTKTTEIYAHVLDKTIVDEMNTLKTKFGE